MKNRRIIIASLALTSIVCMLGGCKKEAASSKVSTGEYQYGQGVTFHSEQPVTYPIYLSDASWYPSQPEWETEGFYAKIKEKTNVTIDLHKVDSTEFEQKILLNVGSGEKTAYVIPKVYGTGGKYIEGGAMVPISDWVQYMPNYTHFVETYHMEPELQTITTEDGKYYRLPGMWEAPIQDYTLMVRDDLFKAAGIDVAAIEKDWTWDDLYAALVKVKAYMVSKGMVKETDYIWTDMWAGTNSKGGGNFLDMVAGTVGKYGIPAGWTLANGTNFDFDRDEFYFSSTSEDYKEFVSIVRKFVDGGILDPETFYMDDAAATARFYRGQSALISVARGQYVEHISKTNEQLGEGNYSTYICVTPKQDNNYMRANNRLETGILITKDALKDLGEDEFIKFLRFVDWLWYSDEGKTLAKWGVEGETYKVDENGKKSLLPGYKCSALGISGSDSDIDLRNHLGYAGGNYVYGGTLALGTDNFLPEILSYTNRFNEYRDVKPVAPETSGTEEQNEQINLWGTPLKDNIDAWTLKFVTGAKDIDADWDEYVESCKNLNCDKLVEMRNNIYKAQKAK